MLISALIGGVVGAFMTQLDAASNIAYQRRRQKYVDLQIQELRRELTDLKDRVLTANK